MGWKSRRWGRSGDGSEFASSLSVNDIRGGMRGKARQGRPLLFLHPGIGLDPKAPVLDRLAEHARVDRTELIPDSAAPHSRGPSQPSTTSPISISIYWISSISPTSPSSACRSAAGSPRKWRSSRQRGYRTSSLPTPSGIKIGDRETRDIADIFAMTEAQFNELAYFEPKIRRP